MKHITLYEEQHKKQFKIRGEPVTDIISKQWMLRKENKEQEKKAKVRNWATDIETHVSSFLWLTLFVMDCIVNVWEMFRFPPSRQSGWPQTYTSSAQLTPWEWEKFLCSHS